MMGRCLGWSESMYRYISAVLLLLSSVLLFFFFYYVQQRQLSKQHNQILAILQFTLLRIQSSRLHSYISSVPAIELSPLQE